MEIESALGQFQGKRVLVTGDTGFKGSWLSLWLHQLGAEVWGYALPAPSEQDLFNSIKLGQLIHHVDGDICDPPGFQKVLNDARPEFLFHLAAQPLVRYSYENPKLTFDTNVGGSINILEGARSCPSLRALVYVTSDKCYLNKEWVWGYRENDELGGNDPYSASKAAAEIVFASYLVSFLQFKEQLGAASARAGNVIGGGDWAKDRIVPDCIRSLQQGKQILLRNPASTRPWQHVLESLSGYLLLACRLHAEPRTYSSSWNFAPAPEAVHTTRDLAQRVVAHWGAGEIREEKQAGSPKEAGLLRLNCDKAHSLLRWRPRWNFERTVAETVSWYKQVSNGAPPLKVSQQQIQAYLQTPV
jgi:CDP-glucose 4,6-dehydratase